MGGFLRSRQPSDSQPVYWSQLKVPLSTRRLYHEGCLWFCSSVGFRLQTGIQILKQALRVFISRPSAEVSKTERVPTVAFTEVLLSYFSKHPVAPACSAHLCRQDPNLSLTLLTAVVPFEPPRAPHAPSLSGYNMFGFIFCFPSFNEDTLLVSSSKGVRKER